MTDKEFQERLISELRNMGIGQRKWHSEKGIPIAVVLMFAAQLVLAGWYSSSVASDVRVNKKDIQVLKKEQLTDSDSALLKEMINSNHELALSVRNEVRDLRAEMKNQVKSTYRLEKKIDIFIEVQKRGNN